MSQTKSLSLFCTMSQKTTFTFSARQCLTGKSLYYFCTTMYENKTPVTRSVLQCLKQNPFPCSVQCLKKQPLPFLHDNVSQKNIFTISALQCLKKKTFTPSVLQCLKQNPFPRSVLQCLKQIPLLSLYYNVPNKALH